MSTGDRLVDLLYRGEGGTYTVTSGMDSVLATTHKLKMMSNLALVKIFSLESTNETTVNAVNVSTASLSLLTALVFLYSHKRRDCECIRSVSHDKYLMSIDTINTSLDIAFSRDFNTYKAIDDDVLANVACLVSPHYMEEHIRNLAEMTSILRNGCS
jgi:hypothetical protein